MRPVTFIRERRWENESFIDIFKVDDSVSNIEGAFRAAVADYLKTPEAKISVEYACGDFNWGDAMMYVPEKIFNQHGIYSVSDNSSVEIFVDQDEVLFPELQAIHLEQDEE